MITCTFVFSCRAWSLSSPFEKKTSTRVCTHLTHKSYHIFPTFRPMSLSCNVMSLHSVSFFLQRSILDRLDWRAGEASQQLVVLELPQKFYKKADSPNQRYQGYCAQHVLTRCTRAHVQVPHRQDAQMLHGWRLHWHLCCRWGIRCED